MRRPTHRRLRWPILVLGSATLLGAGGVLLWQRLTALPDWYMDPASASADRGPPEATWDWRDPGADLPPDTSTTTDLTVHVPAGDTTSSPSSDAPAKRPARKKRSGVRPQAKQVVFDIHLRGLLKNPALSEGVRASRAELQDGRLEAGGVIELSRIDASRLDAQSKQFIARAIAAFPALGQRPVYVALVDKPYEDAGLLQLSEDMKLRIGALELPFATAARRIGLSPGTLRQQLNAELRRLKVTYPSSNGSPPRP